MDEGQVSMSENPHEQQTRGAAEDASGAPETPTEGAAGTVNDGEESRVRGAAEEDSGAPDTE